MDWGREREINENGGGEDRWERGESNQVAATFIPSHLAMPIDRFGSFFLCQSKTSISFLQHNHIITAFFFCFSIVYRYCGRTGVGFSAAYRAWFPCQRIVWIVRYEQRMIRWDDQYYQKLSTDLVMSQVH